MYKTVYSDYSQLMDLVENNGFEIAETVEGCLVDSHLLYGKNDNGELICIAAFENYINEWSSNLKCIIASGEKIKTAENKFYKFQEEVQSQVCA